MFLCNFVSDMRIPLMWRDNVHFTGKTGGKLYRKYHDVPLKIHLKLLQNIPVIQR